MSLSVRKLERLFKRAHGAHQRGELDVAFPIYARIFGQSPELNDFLRRVREQMTKGDELATGVALRASLSRLHPVYGAALHYGAIAGRQLYASSREVGLMSPDKLDQIAAAADDLIAYSIMTTPDNPAALFNWGMSLQVKGDVAKAAEVFRRAAIRGPEDPHTWAKLGDCLMDLGDEANAVAVWHRALAFPARAADTEYNLSFLYLLLGDFAKGLQLHEGRWHCPDFIHSNGRSYLKSPMAGKGWDLDGKRVLVRHEQGNGDQIQMGRFVPTLLAQGAIPILEVQQGLVRLFHSAYPDLEVVGLGDDIPPHDVQIPWMSLPWHFVETESDIPAPMALPPIESTGKLASVRAQLRTTRGLTVGIAWAGSTKHTGDRKRSASPEFLDALAESQDVTFVNLQLGERSDEFARLGPNRINPARALVDFHDTAALMQSLDMVVTVDTAVVHLAGSCHVDTLVALPFNAEWRWMRERSDSPWYPRAMLMRQHAPNAWGELGTMIRSELERRAARRAA